MWSAAYENGAGNILKMAFYFSTLAVCCFLTTTILLSYTTYGGSQLLLTAESNGLQNMKKVDRIQKDVEREQSKAALCKAEELARKQQNELLRKEKTMLERKEMEERTKTLAEELTRKEQEELVMKEKLPLEVLERAKTSEALERAKTSEALERAKILAEKLTSKPQEEMLQEKAIREREKMELDAKWAADQMAKFKREKLAMQELREANSRQLVRQKKSTLEMQETEEQSKSSAVELASKQREPLISGNRSSGVEREQSKAAVCKAEELARKQQNELLRKEKTMLERKEMEERTKTLAEELTRKEQEELVMKEKLPLEVLERAKTSEALERAKTSEALERAKILAEKLTSKPQEEMLQEKAIREREKMELDAKWAADQMAKFKREKLAMQELREANSRQLVRQKKSTLEMQETEEQSKSSAVELASKQREPLKEKNVQRQEADDRAMSAEAPDTEIGKALTRKEKAKLERKELMARAKTAAEKLEKNQMEQLERQKEEERERQEIEERFKSATELLQKAELMGKQVLERAKLSNEKLARKEKRGLHWLGMKREDVRAKTADLATDQRDELLKTENDTEESKERTKVVRARPEFIQSPPGFHDQNSRYLNDSLEFQNFTKISATGLECCLRKTFNFTDQLAGRDGFHTSDFGWDFRACETWGDSDCTLYCFIIISCCFLTVIVLVACLTLSAKAAQIIVAHLVRISPKCVCVAEEPSRKVKVDKGKAEEKSKKVAEERQQREEFVRNVKAMLERQAADENAKRAAEELARKRREDILRTEKADQERQEAEKWLKRAAEELATKQRKLQEKAAREEAEKSSKWAAEVLARRREELARQEKSRLERKEAEELAKREAEELATKRQKELARQEKTERERRDAKERARKDTEEAERIKEELIAKEMVALSARTEALAGKERAKLKDILSKALNAAFVDDYQSSFHHIDNARVVWNKGEQMGLGLAEGQQLEVLEEVLKRMISRSSSNVHHWSERDVHDYLCVASGRLSLPAPNLRDGPVNGKRFAESWKCFLPIWTELGLNEFLQLQRIQDDLDRRLRESGLHVEPPPLHWKGCGRGENPFAMRRVLLDSSSQEFFKVKQR